MFKEKIYNVIENCGFWFLKSVFPEYFAKDPLTPTDRYVEYPFILKNLPLEKSSILDVGCVGSMLPLLLRSLGHCVWGIDIRTYLPEGKIIFAKEDICQSGLPGEMFDVVTAVSTIEHIGLKGRYGEKEKVEGDYQALEEIRRLLKPKGTLLMTVPFGERYEITKFNKIYDLEMLDLLLRGFTLSAIKIEPSPEKGKIALISVKK